MEINNSNKSLPVLTLLALVSFNLAAETAVPPEANSCAGCHGKDGVSVNPMVPTLAGQPYSLIEDNVLAFRAGGRACAPESNDGSPEAMLTQTMCAMVVSLTDQQIAALSEYFEGQAFVPARQNHDQEMAASGAEIHKKNNCELCHSDGGRTTQAMAPVLAGQWTPYLRRTLKALRDGSRQGPREMSAAIDTLSDDDVDALLNFYASQGLSD